MKSFVIDQFEEIAQRHKDSPALHCERLYTYAELRDKARRFAHYLTQQKLTDKEPRIVLNLPKSAEYIIALLGCFYAGMAFSPLDPELPPERQKFILNDINPHMVIGQTEFINALEYEPLETHIKYAPEQLAYIIYTSGSTGQPKGVMLEHKGLMNVISQQIKQFDIRHGDHALLLLSISFDASLSDIFCALLSGACLHIETGEKEIVAANLSQICKKRGITHIDIPPSFLRILSPSDMPKHLRSLVIGGEVCAFDTVKLWANKVLLNNVYGPTEASICTSMITCDKNWHRPLIGQPLNGVTYKIVEGELWIGGIQLARGYWNRPDLTAQKFITDENGNRFYRTGDSVIIHQDNEISFSGRIDRQVKIRGQLTELEDIEQSFLSLAFIARACVFVQKDSKGQNILIGCYSAKEPAKTEDIIQHLKQQLPDWMIPTTIHYLTTMPLTASGKVDVKKLEAIVDKASDKNAAKKEHTKPAIPLQWTLYKIWCEILKRDDFGITDSFFGLGGDSIDAIDFTMRAAKEKINISPSMLARHFTIADLSRMIEKLAPHDQSMDHTQLKEIATKGLSFDIKPCDTTAGQGHKMFMTGATGFLGAKLLYDLLQKTNADFICLVRAQNAKDGLERIKTAIALHGIALPIEQQTRLTIMCGDLTAPQFGVTDEEWQTLINQTHHIIHCAAIVNMVKSFDELRAANFDACKTILQLAQSAKAQHIHYISTLSVFVSTDQNKGRVYETDMLDNICKVYGGYAQTKVAAELLFHNPEITKNIAVTSYRLGLITGDTNTGASASHDFLSTFFRGLTALGVYPENINNELEVDVTPVNYAADILSALIIQKTQHEIYHIANKQGFTMPQIVNALKAKSLPLTPITAQQWQDLPQNKKLNKEQQAAWLGLCRCLDEQNYQRYRSMDLFQATHIEFDTTQTRRACPEIDCPAAQDTILNLYLEKSLT